MAYTVKSGDSLWAIAQATLGDGSRWPEIQAANGITGTTIQPGQVFNIPGQDAPAPVADPVTEEPVENTLSTPVEPAPPSPTLPLTQDPAYNAFMAGLGVQESDIAGNLAVRREGYLQQYNEALPGYADARITSERNIGTNAENRGMYQSGQRLRDQSESLSRIDAQQAAAQGAMTRNQAGAERTAAQDLSSLRREQALQEINARERLSTRDLNAIGAPL